MIQLIEVRNLTREETGQLVGWAAQEGWNPSPYDADAFFTADPEGFFGCFVDGELASGISAVAYGDSFGFIGLYITQPKFRGKGYGLKVWNAGLSRLSGRTIGLDGVPAQQANYEKMGFRKFYGSSRWSGWLPSQPSAATVATAVSQDLASILSFDRHYFPSDRTDFLRAWLDAPRVALVSEQDGILQGYAVIRHCTEGCKVGPLFARDVRTAIGLLNACAPTAAGATVHLDIPDTQIGFTSELERLGFQRGFETARMYLGPPPAIDMSGVFAVTTLELG
jgi:GNAT superfamily N-acetyltransferase